MQQPANQPPSQTNPSNLPQNQANSSSANNEIKQLIEQIKSAPANEKYIYMNKLKDALREMSEHQRKEVIEKLTEELMEGHEHHEHMDEHEHDRYYEDREHHEEYEEHERYESHEEMYEKSYEDYEKTEHLYENSTEDRMGSYEERSSEINSSDIYERTIEKEEDD
ncbi:hypothetical protein GWK41_03650 [Persephonella atlantica]|uniref:Uncharacterized protein n=1 Tax=Persephonella atlantica TaxID=2699429 RepID=A0ABS1GGU8_9AQUI|nr:hypothetical protein [Persephonella atlantica]MBK3332162.1 hypothetical protein [Persephonella atlantica]